MLGLSDNQLSAVMDLACSLPVEKRDLYLRRIAAMLTQRGRGHVTDADVVDVAQLALCGLIQQTADAPDTMTSQPTHQRPRLGQCVGLKRYPRRYPTAKTPLKCQ